MPSSPHSAASLAAEVQDLRQRVTGTVALPDEVGYEAAEPWNRTAVVRPAAVVSVADGDDIVEAVRFATAHELKIAVQATGHWGASHGADVLLVHTGKLSECSIDPTTGTARVGAGVTAQTLIDAAAEHGLAPILGSAGSVSVAGFISGGGVGPMVTTYGLSSDYVRSLELVTGDGQRRHVSALDHPDLFWAVRGGKVSAGIITELELELVPLETLYGGAIYFDVSDASAVLHEWASWSDNLPEQVTTSIAFVEKPPVPGVPEVLAGRRTVTVRFASTLSAHVNEQLLAPIRTAAEPILDTVSTMPYREIGQIHAEPTTPVPLIQDQRLLTSLPSQAVDAIVDVAGPGSRSPLPVVELRRFGGALLQPRHHASAFSNRDARYALTGIGILAGPDPAAVETALHDTLEAVAPWSTGVSLANFAARADPQAVANAYDDETRGRLRIIADRYDPSGVLVR